MRVQLAADPDAQLVANKGARRITGRLIPFDTVATPAVGPRCAFSSTGTIEADGPLWLNLEHTDAHVLGSATGDDVSVHSDGLHAVFSILPTTAGDDALVEAAAGARTGLSVEAEILEHTDADDHILITRSRITGAALVRRPAFTDATVTDVAATAATTEPSEEDTVNDTPEVVAAAEPTPTLSPIYAAAPALPRLEDYIIATGQNDQTRLASMNRLIRAADPNTLIADIAGLIPKVIVGPVVGLRDGSAPLFNALGPNPAPPGASFRIPKITTHLIAAVPAVELSDVTGPLDVGEVVVPLSFVKRAVAISQEAIVHSQPGIVEVAAADLTDAVNLGVEAVTISGIEGATGTNGAVTIALDGSDAWAKLAAGVAAHYGACGSYPTLFAAAPDVWAKLAGFTNVSGVPLITSVNQNLAGGAWGSLFGIPVVVSYRMTAGKSFLISETGVKTWADGPITLQLTTPSTFKYELGGARRVGLSVADGKFITPVAISATEIE